MTTLQEVLQDAAVDRVLAVLNGDGEEARIVGGAVRNLLIGRPVHDFDIATTALPDEVMRRAGHAGIKAVPTGIAHGTVTLVVDGRPFEVTTLRSDTETDGRHATVIFGRDWAQDAARRDFTFNALSLDRRGVIHDTTGGQVDLAAGRVRFIGDPRQRIREDYLRSLRFFRFHAFYGRGDLDRPALDAVIAEREGLSRLSRERVRSELMKLLVAPLADETVAVVAGIGVLNQLLGGVPRLSRLQSMIRVEAMAGLDPDPVRRLASLSLEVREDADRLRDRLRLANKQHEALLALGDGVPAPTPDLGDADRRRLSYCLSAPVFRARVLACWARAGASDEAAWRDLWSFATSYAPPKLPWSGSDVTARGLRGAEVGRGLRELEEAWALADFPMDASALNRLLEQVIPINR